MASKTLSLADIAHNTERYDVYHNVFKMEDGWHKGNRERNFALLLKIADFTGVPISGTTCLDVGCGTGELSQWLRQRGAKQYLGIDIYEPSLKKAHAKYPHETFLHQDFLAAQFNQKFDYVFCSGALTVKQISLNNYEFFEEAVRKMWQLSEIGVAFNILTDDDIIVDHEIFFYSPKRVEVICQAIAPEAHLVWEPTEGVHQIHVYMYRDAKQLA